MELNDILTMNPEYPTDIAVELEQYINNKVQNKSNESSLEEKVFLELYWLEMDLGSSGINSYFHNNGDEINKLLNYLELANATYMVDLLQKAISVFPNSTIPDDLDEVLDILDDIDNEETNILWDELENKYFENHESELFIYLIQYVKNNLNKFE